MSSQPEDLVIVGAGAAGLAAGIFAAESGVPHVIILDGARKPGAKILVSGGGRCNVTNVHVAPEDFHGGSRNTIRNVLRAFDHRNTVDWMASLGVELKLEETGKYFPVSDSAHTVLAALLGRFRALGGELRPGVRVAGVAPGEDAFHIALDGGGEMTARRVILATGGMSLPKSGSDGAGIAMAERLGHRIIPATPALVPLVMKPADGPAGRFAELSGLAIDAALELRPQGRDRALCRVEGSLLFTHFGISGPAALDFSRHWLRTRLENPGAPAEAFLSHPSFHHIADAEGWIRRTAAASPRKSAHAALQELWPERWARACTDGLDRPLGQMPRPARVELASRLTALPLPIAGDRGYSFAETTAGGVDLRDVDYRTLESRVVPGLYFCGEMLDVDGRIGGFNFQWAWASGHVAGRGAARRETRRK